MHDFIPREAPKGNADTQANQYVVERSSRCAECGRAEGHPIHDQVRSHVAPSAHRRLTADDLDRLQAGR